MYLIPVFSKDSGAAASRLAQRVSAALPVVLALCVQAWPQFSDGAGTAELTAITIVPAARPAGLAGAYSALAEGASSIGVNPAGLARESGQHFSGSVRPDMVRVGSVAYTRPGFGGRLAVSASYVDYDEILATDENQSITGSVHPFSLYPAVSYARTHGERWRWGATVKAAHETLGEFEGTRSAFGAGFDAGVQYQPAVRNVGFGASVTNVGRKFTGHTASDGPGPLPGMAKAGIFYLPRGKSQLALTADVEAPFYSPPVLAVGTEYRVLSVWELRAGTRWNADDFHNLYGWLNPSEGIRERGGEAVKLAAGTSVHVGPVDVDYAAQWWRELGLVHSLTVAWAID
jgi:hypothetical protein